MNPAPITSLIGSNGQNPYDLLPYGVCIIDRDLGVHSWNSTLANWTGIEAEYACAMNLATMYPEFLTNHLNVRLSEAFDSGNNVILSPSLHRNFIPIQLFKSGGAKMVQKAQIRPIGDGSPYAIVIIEDVTAAFKQAQNLRKERRALKKSESKLTESRDALQAAGRETKAALQAKNDLLTHVDHEFRAPMAAIMKVSEELLNLSDTSVQRQAVEVIRIHGQRLQAIFENLSATGPSESNDDVVEFRGEAEFPPETQSTIANPGEQPILG